MTDERTITGKPVEWDQTIPIESPMAEMHRMRDVRPIEAEIADDVSPGLGSRQLIRLRGHRRAAQLATLKARTVSAMADEELMRAFVNAGLDPDEWTIDWSKLTMTRKE